MNAIPELAGAIKFLSDEELDAAHRGIERMQSALADGREDDLQLLTHEMRGLILTSAANARERARMESQ